MSQSLSPKPAVSDGTAGALGCDDTAIAVPDRRNDTPLSQRSARELWVRSNEMAQMAKSATMQETKVALETLARRFATLATQRELDEITRPNK